MNLRVLLVESEPEDVLFLREVLLEIESGGFWTNWVHIEVLHAMTSIEAVAILGNEPIDVILLDPNLTDSQGVDTFRRIQLAADRIPMLLLTGAEDDSIAVQMIREGAQDFLIKNEVDCAPLAHAIRNAMERHRMVAAMRASTTADSLTGLPNRAVFLTYAGRDLKLAERLGRRLMVLVAEPRDLIELCTAFGDQRRDLALVEAADHLRSLAGPTDLIARIGEMRFAVSIFDTEAESVEEAWARIHSAAAVYRLAVGAAIFDAQRPVALEVLLEQAALDLAPAALAALR
jgi:two-component system cell cycle response regulator